MTDRPESGRGYGGIVAYSIAFFILLVVVGSLTYYELYVQGILPFSYNQAVEFVVAVCLGIVVITFLGREINKVTSRLLGAKRGNMIFVVFRFVAYAILAVVLLAIAGISGTALLAGGTFAGLVLGLAAQTVLSNVIAGVMIILARPYKVGDRITFISSQYGVISAIYPPKFFSVDSIMPGYSGRVLDIGLAYTEIRLDDGPSMKVPNSMMAQAAVVSHEIEERWVRTRYELPNTIDPKEAVSVLTDVLKKNEWVTKPDSISVLISSTTPTTYVVSVDVVCKGNLEEPPRSSLLLDIMAAANKLREASRTPPNTAK